MVEKYASWISGREEEEAIELEKIYGKRTSGRTDSTKNLYAYDLYRKIWSGRQDLNLRPLDPQSSALPDCATPRIWKLYQNNLLLGFT